MQRPRTTFGVELRRRRLAAGLSLSDLAALVHYSRSHLSRVETSGKPPSLSLARRCDTELGADGALTRLVERPTAGPPKSTEVSPVDRWWMGLSANGGGTLIVTHPGEPWEGGEALVANWALSAQAATDASADRVLAGFEEMFRQIRSVGQTVPPVTLLPLVIAHAHALRVLASTAGSAQRGPVLLLAARFGEYAGWMHQEAGDDRAAAWWTDWAVGLAREVGDRDMTPYALVRRALIALYQGDSATTVALAQQAQAADCSARVRGLAALREAQGRAISADYDGCMFALERAAALLEPSNGQEQVLGSWTVPDQVALASGWCLYDLGRPVESAEILSRQLAAIPAHAVRARARYGARLALAHAGGNDVEQACTVAAGVLDAMPMVQSATVRADVRDLSRMLGRWRANPTVRDLLPRFAAALALPAPAATRTG
ncbi:helix-turn-helix domain-containing protein [Phytohabitans houttuyneae]|nr:helix-turn-helix transcriptional regulator [Phytohabitans houttuyneae]